MIIATDLDRTLLPNGYEEYGHNLPLFFQLIRKNKLTLVYATGRNWKLFQEAKKIFKIEDPDYFIGEVGTVLYEKSPKKSFFQLKNKLVISQEWQKYLKNKAKNWNAEKLKKRFQIIKELKLQEKDKQNTYKLSYYLSNTTNQSKILTKIKTLAQEETIKINLISSWDPLKKVRLIDILPAMVTKTTALEFIRRKKHLSKEEVVYCGDSGNDIAALTIGYKSILVKNAREEIKKKVLKINQDLGRSKNLYIAKGVGKWNGYYVAGILEGLKHFKII